MTKATEPVYEPAVSVLAEAATDTVTLAVAPAANVPPAEDKLIHGCGAVAVHEIAL